MKRSLISLAALAMASLGAGAMNMPVQYTRGRMPRSIRHICWKPAEDTGLFPRATKRRATRGQRRAAFQAHKRVFGSARQARRETFSRNLEVFA